MGVGCLLNQDPIDVAVAVIEQNGKYLIAQRKAGDSFGGCWEFPGGKVNPGESLETCLTREIQEELAVPIAVGRKLQVIEHQYPERSLRLHFYLCRILSGEPQTIECADWRWVAPEELGQFQFPPASGPILDVIARRSRSNLGDCFEPFGLSQ
ncbi:MAG: 8-oxo-dGTP diphosphatase MutT [Candidatus Omnitrophica bacterium]|nr:8-oxo-dGTP diphosphatase MutT [Candidatus Omnitrophota bacterium]